MMFSDGKQIYRPEAAPRTGEGNAWILTFMVFVIWLFLHLAGQRVSGWITFFLVVLILMAGLISLNNWVERRTLIQMDTQGIYFENGLRKLDLTWDEIEKVSVRPAVWGKRVRVEGQGKQFDFHTLGEVKYRGAVKARTGFVQGEEMLRLMILHSGLRIAEELGEGYTYTRR
ncbi:MAG: hypothetical protein ACOY16_11485 [Chloroflexota bacterium]